MVKKTSWQEVELDGHSQSEVRGREIDDLMVPFYFYLISNSCSGGCLRLGGIFLLEFIFSVNVLTGLIMGVCFIGGIKSDY